MSAETQQPLKNRGLKTINLKKAIWDRLMIIKIKDNETSLAGIINKALDVYGVHRKKLLKDD